jgi:hypothetical protein
MQKMFDASIKKPYKEKGNQERKLIPTKKKTIRFQEQYIDNKQKK